MKKNLLFLILLSMTLLLNACTKKEASTPEEVIPPKIEATQLISVLTITNDFLPSGLLNKSYSATLEASGGEPPYRWSATGLPSYLSLSATSGVISGTPEDALVNYDVNITVSDSAGNQVSKRFTISNNVVTPNVKADGFYVQSIIDDYERKIIDAINYNDFSQVKNTLIPGSNIYNMQKMLITNRNNQRIQEKLIQYQIKNMIPLNGCYKVYVDEIIGIKYPSEGDFNAVNSSWVYTVIYSNEKWRISDMEKWNKN